MMYHSCKTAVIIYFFLCVVSGDEVSEEIYAGDLDSETEAKLERLHDDDVSLPPLNNAGAELPLTLLSAISMSSLGTVTMKSTVDVAGQDAPGLLADLGTMFDGLMENADGFYNNSDVFNIMYPLIMQLVNPTPRVIVQVQQLLVVQRLECCKSGEETCCGIIAQMMADTLANRFKELQERQEERDEDSHRVFWRQLDNLLNMPVIAVALETPDGNRELLVADKMVEDTGDSVKVTKRNRDGSTSKKTIYPRVPDHMLDEDKRQPLEESDAALEDGDASHVFTMGHVVGEKGEDNKKIRQEEDKWAAAVPRRSLLAIGEEEGEEEEELNEEDKWAAKIPRRSLMVEEELGYKNCKYNDEKVKHNAEVKNENCYNCSCQDGRILCHSKFVCDTNEDMGEEMDKTVIVMNKLLKLGRVSQEDMKYYLTYRNQLLKHMQKAKIKEETTIEAMEMIINGGNGPGGIPGPRLLPSLVEQLKKLHEQRETQIRIFVGLVNSLESVKHPLHEEL